MIEFIAGFYTGLLAMGLLAAAKDTDSQETSECEPQDNGESPERAEEGC